MNLKLLFLEKENFSSHREKQKIIFPFSSSWLISYDLCWEMWLENIEMANHFSQLLWNFPEKKTRSKCKAGYIRGIHCNDSTIRLNKQRKVFNYSIEIFIKNFSHYFTLFFALKFFRCCGSWRKEKTTLFYSNWKPDYTDIKQ